MPDDHATPRFKNIIRSEAELREILPTPSVVSLEKEVDHLDEVCRKVIAHSPFLILGSADGRGRVDVSPKGDPAGFVKVLDDRTLAIPDRKGNRRADTHKNILAHPHASAIFLVPGSGITLRVVGRAFLTADPDLLADLAHQGKPPELATVIEVETAYIHCAKCTLRSHIWEKDLWPDLSEMPSMGEALRIHTGKTRTLDEMNQLIDQSIRERMY